MPAALGTLRNLKNARLNEKKRTSQDSDLTRVGDTTEEWDKRWLEFHDYYSRYPNNWAIIRGYIREPVAEAIGCMLLILFGSGVDCQALLSTNTKVAPTPKGDFLSTSFVWGVGAALGVWSSGGISGGHNNPVITIMLAIFRGFPWKKVPGYIVGQVFGAWLGALLTYANYFHAIDIYEGGEGIRTTPGTALYFATYSLDYVPAAACFFNEFLATFILMIVVFAVTDSRNGPPPAGTLPLVVFLLLFGIGAAWGMQTAYALNPARDLGPRIMTAMVGYGSAVFTYRSHYWLWCAICGPLAGGFAGALFYDVFVFTGSESWINRPNTIARQHLAEPRPSERANAIAGPPTEDPPERPEDRV